QQATAKSLVMLRAFKLSLEKDTMSYELEEDLGFYDFETDSTNWAALGISSDDPDTAYLEMAREGIACDPTNREWYELIVKLPCRSREDKKIVEDALEEMAAHFPDDPFPYLELAGLYQQKNAYRKAEKALEEAARRAPYDNRVIEKKTIGYLISAEINLKRGKYHLVGTDLEKAECLGCRQAAPFIRAKQTALELISSQAEPVASRMFSDLAGLARIQGLSVLFLELSSRPRQKIADVYNETLRQGINAEIKTELASISEIQSTEMRLLLYPVPLAYMPAMPTHPLHTTPAILPEEEILRLLPCVHEADILAVCDLLLDMGWYDTAYKELARRLSETSAAGRPLMDFYCTVLADLSGENTDVEHLLDIVDYADAETDRKLKQAAFNLAPHARGELQLALRYYDLELLMFRNEWDDAVKWDDEDGNEAIDDGDWLDEDLDDEDDAYYEGMTPARIIEDLEAIVDRMKFRDTPPAILRIMRPVIFNSRPETRFVKDILQTFPPDELARLSPEARVLFLEEG
ncbi:MAG: tetratricopeptide repeat protein, partial [Desulfobacterales bacterium]